MTRGTVWLIGVLGVAVVWGGAVAYKARPVERQIALSTVSELKRRGIDRRFEGLAIEIDGRDLKLIGTALTPADREQALAIAAATPGVGRVVDEIKVAPETRPFVFRAVRSGDGSATLIGVVAQPDAIERLVEVGRGLFANRLTARLRLARGAPAGDWFAAAKLAVEVIAHIEQGEAVLTDRRLTLTGRAADDAALDAAKAALARGLPAGYEAKMELLTAIDELLRGGPIAAVKDCQDLVDKVLAAHPFRFDPGSAALRAAHGRLLDRLALAVRRCASLYLQIYAAGDPAIADPVANLRLAEARAQALAEALAQRGVPRERMAALGRGRVDPRERAAVPDVEFRVADSVVPVVRPYVWQFEKHLDGAGTITGHHPSREVAGTLIGLARPALRGALADQSRLAHGAPPGDWLGAATLAIDAIAQLESGAATLRDSALHIRGVAKDDETLRLVAATVAERTPKGFTATLDLATTLDEALKGPVLTAAERCQALVDAVAGTRAVEFVFDGPALLERQRQLFQRLAAATTRCPAFTLEIGAHAAGTGDPEAARALSARGGVAVADALARAGADRGRLRAVGYGNAQPVADAKTEAGRAGNRRIAFRVIP
jgi:OOP family OmpA-OmpF porin